MYYLNSFLIYSFLGFVMESTVYKINKVFRYSGIFYGPMTTVYGFGILAILLMDKYLFSKLKISKFLKIIFIYLTLAIVLTFIEYLGGNILHNLFNVDMWNYVHKKYHIGKYICLELSFVWGLFGVLFLYIIKPFMDKIINVIPRKATLFFFFIFLIDTFFTLVFKIKNLL